MGNSENKTVRKNNRNYSLDLGHQLPHKIKPTGQVEYKLQFHAGKQPRNQSIDSLPTTARKKVDLSQLLQLSQQDIRNRKYYGKSNSLKLKQLTKSNDQLRQQLIRISTELTERIKNKKNIFNKAKRLQEYSERDDDDTSTFKQQLQNAYKIIEKHKKVLRGLKGQQGNNIKFYDIQNKIAETDKQIEKTTAQIKGVKNITENQMAQIQKMKVDETMLQYEKQIQQLRGRIKQLNNMKKQSDGEQKKQHAYMLALQTRTKQRKTQLLNENDPRKKIKRGKINEVIKNLQKPQSKQTRQQQMKYAQKQVQQLKYKHDQYHKKINLYVRNSRQIKVEVQSLRRQIQQKDRIIQSCKDEKQKYIKLIKDHLYILANRNKSDVRTQSQILDKAIQQSKDQDNQQGTPQIDIKSRNQQSKHESQVSENNKIMNRKQRTAPVPKIWKNYTTRSVFCGSKQYQQKAFPQNQTFISTRDTRIVQINVWCNRKQQIIALQFIYQTNGQMQYGQRSDTSIGNTKVKYEEALNFKLSDQDYLKCIVGTFNRNYLNFLTLISSEGRTFKLGKEKEGGQYFIIGTAESQIPIHICGASSFDGTYWRINRLEAQLLAQTL